MKFAEVFINRFGRLRSGWRFVVYIIAVFLLTGLIGGIAGAILYYLPVGFSPDSLLGFVVPQSILLLVAVFLGWLCGKFFEDLPFRALGAWFTRRWLSDFAGGFTIGAMSIGGAALILIAVGATTFQFNQDAGQSAIFLTLVVSLGIFTVAAAAEEALFRGYIFQTFLRAELVLFAFSLSSLIFAAAHIGNFSANYLSFFNTLLAGVWFGAAYLKTRTLWLPFGMHLAWNWMQGAVLGISVSGITSITTAPLLHATNTGAEIWTGGNYGIEAGFACTIVLLISTLIIWFAPFFAPTEEMLILTSREKLKLPAAADVSDSPND